MRLRVSRDFTREKGATTMDRPSRRLAAACARMGPPGGRFPEAAVAGSAVPAQEKGRLRFRCSTQEFFYAPLHCLALTCSCCGGCWREGQVPRHGPDAGGRPAGRRAPVGGHLCARRLPGLCRGGAAAAGGARPLDGVGQHHDRHRVGVCHRRHGRRRWRGRCRAALPAVGHRTAGLAREPQVQGLLVPAGELLLVAGRRGGGFCAFQGAGEAASRQGC